MGALPCGCPCDPRIRVHGLAPQPPPWSTKGRTLGLWQRECLTVCRPGPYSRSPA